MNDGMSVFLFRDRLHAHYVQKRYIPEHYVVKIEKGDEQLIQDYCIENKLDYGVKIVEKLFCDVDTHVERFELFHDPGFEAQKFFDYSENLKDGLVLSSGGSISS
jgi:hypothetical protein